MIIAMSVTSTYALIMNKKLIAFLSIFALFLLTPTPNAQAADQGGHAYIKYLLPFLLCR
jgi:hypothetical protein